MTDLQTELPAKSHELASELKSAEILSLPEIREKAAQKIQDPEIKKEIDSLLVMASGLDSLCEKVANRRLFHQRLEEEIYRAHRTGSPLSLILLDLDNFGPLNKTIGILAGDELLQEVARALREGVKMSDTVARLGGDEFAILMPETPVVRGLVVAARVLKQIPNLTIPSRPTEAIPGLGASVGIAQLNPEEDARAFFERTNTEGLLAVKRQGKNMVGLVTKNQNFSIDSLRSKIMDDGGIIQTNKAALLNNILDNNILINE